MADDTHERIPAYAGALATYGTTVLAAAVAMLARGDRLPGSYRTSDPVLAVLAVAPRAGRAWAAAFSIVGASDALQHVYARVRTD